mmetsp:Transcript_34398/g.90496  ORF Transcript_34398/g.90496 Transcript_34398/m.90496 type:complete len:434 (+) Transcript_34398:2265-3566(+)
MLVAHTHPVIQPLVLDRGQLPVIADEDEVQAAKGLLAVLCVPEQFVDVAQRTTSHHRVLVDDDMGDARQVGNQFFGSRTFWADFGAIEVAAPGDGEQRVVRLAANVVGRHTGGCEHLAAGAERLRECPDEERLPRSGGAVHEHVKRLKYWLHRLALLLLQCVVVNHSLVDEPLLRVELGHVHCDWYGPLRSVGVRLHPRDGIADLVGCVALGGARHPECLAVTAARHMLGQISVAWVGVDDAKAVVFLRLLLVWIVELDPVVLKVHLAEVVQAVRRRLQVGLEPRHGPHVREAVGVPDLDEVLLRQILDAHRFPCRQGDLAPSLERLGQALVRQLDATDRRLFAKLPSATQRPVVSLWVVLDPVPVGRRPVGATCGGTLAVDPDVLLERCVARKRSIREQLLAAVRVALLDGALAHELGDVGLYDHHSRPRAA